MATLKLLSTVQRHRPCELRQQPRSQVFLSSLYVISSWIVMKVDEKMDLVNELLFPPQKMICSWHVRHFMLLDGGLLF